MPTPRGPSTCSWDPRLRARTRHLRRSAHRDGHGRGGPRRSERRLGSEQRGGPDCQPCRARHDPRGRGNHGGRRARRITHAFRLALVLAATLAAIAAPISVHRSQPKGSISPHHSSPPLRGRRASATARPEPLPHCGLTRCGRSDSLAGVIAHQTAQRPPAVVDASLSVRRCRECGSRAGFRAEARRASREG